MGMSPEQWESVKELYESALERDPTQRADFLLRNSADESVREEVLRLLAGQKDATSFLSVPPYAQANHKAVVRQTETRFAPGEVLAGRFRIASFIAAGGMGEVYEAEDQELKETLAIKTIRSEILEQSNSLERFKREVRLARKVTHPNICRVYDIFRHERMQGKNSNVIVFVSMELLQGETLSQRIRRTGPMSPDEALPLISQIASGLEAAHHAGVVHRDFKPGNVILVPDGETNQIRTVITDFGLAIRTGIDTSKSSELTATHGVIGTPAYMAPEQFEGREVTKLTDIYALGLVIHEMVTGVRPFSTDNPFPSSESTLSKATGPAQGSTTKLSVVWEQTISRCLQRDPNARYSSALDVARALSEQKSEITPTRRPRWLAAAGGLALVLVAGSYIGFNVQKIRGYIHGSGTSETGNSSTPASAKSHPSVAVMEFRNVSGRADKAWYSTQLPGMLRTQLAAGEQLRTVSGEDIDHMAISLSLPEEDTYGQDTLQKIYKNLNADYLVVGTYMFLGGGQVRLDLKLQDTRNGETLASLSKKGREDNIDALVDEAGIELRGKLGAGPVTLAEEAEVRASRPASTEAARLYSEGVSKLHEFENVAARDLLLKAVEEDPKFAMAHSALASAYTALGYDEKARISARNAFELRSELPRQDRFIIEGSYREAGKEWDQAIDSYRALFGYFPDNLEYGMMLAKAQIHGEKAKDALKTIESLRRFPEPAREDPRIDLIEAEANISLGDFGKAQTLASSGAQKARANGVKLILADALFGQAEASENLNQTKEALEAAEEAARIYGEAGNRSGEARALEVTGNVLGDRNEFPAALASYKKELGIARDIGNRKLEASALNNMALVLKDQGDSDGAAKMFEQALPGFRDINDNANAAQVLVNIAGIQLEEGNLASAKKNYEAALSTSQEINAQAGVSTATAGLGTVLDAQGDLSSAKKSLDRAIQIDISAGMKSAPADKLISVGDVLLHQGNLLQAAKAYQDALDGSRAAGDKNDAAFALLGLGQIAFEGADFKEARKNYEEALAIWTEIGEKRNIANAQLSLAELAIQEGHPSDALAPVKSASEQFRSLRSKDAGLTAAIVLSQALLAQGRVAEAARELSAQATLAAKSQSPSSRIRFEIATARVESASGKAIWGKTRLNTALTEAKKLGLAKYQMECRLAAEELPQGLKKSADSRARLAQLSKEATEKGYILIAHKAAELASS